MQKHNQMILPQYLERVKASKKYYGTLEKVDRDWHIKAEPQVMELIRRVFNATSFLDEQGIARIPCTKTINGDLNWFMMRYPLKIVNSDMWNTEIENARKHMTTIHEFNRKKIIEEAPIQFKGKLYEYQKEGLAFLCRSDKCLLADEMGLGKTIEALAFLCKNNKYPVIVVTPPHLMEQWDREIKRFLDVETCLINGLKPYTLPEANIYIIHYLLMRGWYEELIRFEFDTIIFDEVQELRHIGTMKYDSCTELAKYSNHVIGLSGTPIYNYGYEIFNVFNGIEQNILGSSRYFLAEWTNPWDHRMVANPETLGRHLRDRGLMIRRRKEDVLKELPPKRRAIQYVSKDNKMFVGLMTKSVQLAKEISFAEDDEKSMLMMMAVQNLRRATGIAKAQHVAEYVKILLESEEPVVLFAFHHDVMHLYEKYFFDYHPYFVTGKQTRKQKQENIDNFMKGHSNLIIVNLRTTAGLNLQRARCVVFGELDFSPAVHFQAEDRVHRIGQKDSVLAYYLVTNTISDIEMMNCLDLKEEQFRGLMHDKEETTREKEFSQVQAQSFMWNIIKKLQTEDTS